MRVRSTATGGMTAGRSPPCPAMPSPNCARWSRLAGSRYPTGCLRSPASSVISDMRRSVSSRTCRARRKANCRCPTCCSSVRRSSWCSTISATNCSASLRCGLTARMPTGLSKRPANGSTPPCARSARPYHQESAPAICRRYRSRRLCAKAPIARWCSRRRTTSPPVTSSRSCWRSASLAPSPCRPSRSIARSGA